MRGGPEGISRSRDLFEVVAESGMEDDSRGPCWQMPQSAVFWEGYLSRGRRAEVYKVVNHVGRENAKRRRGRP